MTIPYIIAPPDGLPVPMQAMKDHLRVAHDDDDAEIEDLQAGAVAMLDGWGGVLGRCIMPQTWAIEFTGMGPHLLPFPDASDVTANGNPVDVKRRGLGLIVSPDVDDDEDVKIEAVYGLSSDRMPTLQTLIKLQVARDFDRVSGPEYDAMTRTIDAHIAALRWRRL